MTRTYTPSWDGSCNREDACTECPTIRNLVSRLVDFFFLIQFYVPFKIISAHMRRANQNVARAGLEPTPDSGEMIERLRNSALNHSAAGAASRLVEEKG